MNASTWRISFLRTILASTLILLSCNENIHETTDAGVEPSASPEEFSDMDASDPSNDSRVQYQSVDASHVSDEIGPDVGSDITTEYPVEPCQNCAPDEECINDSCIEICIPDCEGKVCGSDECGGFCGQCPGVDACIEGSCIPLCINCDSDEACPSGFTCQGDPLGTLGLMFCAPPCEESSPCPSGMECTPGAQFCVSSPKLQCYEGNVYAGNSCGDLYWINEQCPTDLPCSDGNAQCSCPPENCDGRECGTNGCPTGTCGECAPGEDCVEGICCVSSCAGKSCGEDGCGRICGVCDSNQFCNEAGLCCSPVGCEGKECGNDEFGCPCGTCGPLGECVNGVCSCTPACDGLECGADGCGKSCGCCAEGFACETGTCEPVDICGGCPPDFSCEGNGKCVRPSVSECWDVIADEKVSWKGQCIDPHTVRYCDNDLEVIVSCVAPDAVRRGGSIAKGAIWCGENTETGLMDCQTNPPCKSSPCNPFSIQSGCQDDASCSDNVCEPCEPSCEDRECGDDGCGKPCGACLSSIYSNEIDEQMPAQQCLDGMCQCTPSCIVDSPLPCGPDGCGGICGTCPEGDVWTCGIDRFCICAPACDGKQCGDDLCEGACGPVISISDSIQKVIPTLEECPDSTSCGGESQQCEGPNSNALCLGTPVEVLPPQEADDVLGFGSDDPLPQPLDDWVAALIADGNPCSSTCSQSPELRDILLYVQDDPEENENIDTTQLPPQNLWLSIHVTLRVLNNKEQEAWLFTYYLNNSGAVTGSDFRPTTTATVGNTNDLSPEWITELESLRTLALKNEVDIDVPPIFTSTTFTMSYIEWGCSPHHTRFTEAYPNQDKTLTIIGNRFGKPLEVFWVANSNDE